MTQFVLPGDKIIVKNALKSNEQHKIGGRGIVIRNDDEPHAAITGFVHDTPNWLWINTFSQKYFPQTGEKVIGIATQKIGDFWKVDIGAAEKAEIEFTSFENATKRNRPDVRIGDLLYGNIKVVNKYLPPVMSCVNELGKAKGQGLIPRTASGTIISISCSYSRRLLESTCKILSLIEKGFAVEITIGVNGRMYIHGTLDDIKTVKSIIQRCERVAEVDVTEVFDEMIAAARGEIPVKPVDVEMKKEVKDEIEDDDDPMDII